MEYQFTHKYEKGHREQSEGRDGSENSCHYRNKAWYPPQEEISCNHIDNEKGKGNGQVGEEQEHHTPKEQANDQPPFHELPLSKGVKVHSTAFSMQHLGKPAPRHPEERDGNEDSACRDDDENGPFRDSHCPYVGYPFYDTLTHIVNSKIDDDGTSKAADDKHDTIEVVLSFLIEMSVYEIGSDMPSLSQKPGGCEKNDPQQGVFGCLHDPYRSLCKQISHTNRVTDSSRYKDQYGPGHKSHGIDYPVQKSPEPFQSKILPDNRFYPWDSSIAGA